MNGKLFQGFVLALVGAVSSSPQAVPDRQSDNAVVAFISTYLNSDHVAWVSVIGKEFAWRGDSIASLISQVVGKQSIDRSKLEKMLGLLREAFARPAIIRNAGDRNPVATFALLDQLQQDPSWDASALSEIDSTRRFVVGALKSSIRQPDRDTVALITDYVNNDHQAMVSVIYKRVAWMGDSAASAVIQAIGRQTVDQPKLTRILGILRAAFERPAIIKNAADRNPDATFAFLDQLQQDPSWDASALAEIDSARQYVIGGLKNSK